MGCNKHKHKEKEVSKMQEEVKTTERIELPKLDTPKVKRVVDIEVEKWCNCCGKEAYGDCFNHLENGEGIAKLNKKIIQFQPNKSEIKNMIKDLEDWWQSYSEQYPTKRLKYEYQRVYDNKVEYNIRRYCEMNGDDLGFDDGDTDYWNGYSITLDLIGEYDEEGNLTE